MRLRVLGTAAGGGVPQWNCTCAGCDSARTCPDLRRTHASIAVEVEDGSCYVINATPDITQQIDACTELWPGPEHRRTPVCGVLLTDAELDHTLGVLRLREARHLRVLAPPAVLASLSEGLRFEEILEPYAGVTWEALPAEKPLRIGHVEVSTIAVSDKRPRYAADLDHPGPWSVALRISDTASGKTLVYSPCVAEWTDVLDAALVDADCVFLDGTFWDDDEPILAGFSPRTATGMGHLPITETAARLAATAAPLRYYTHLNNTNPLVDPHALQHRTLAELGITVAAERDVIDL
jgi:pyrroloquinoline quinone biosynthesis protein B